MKPHRLLFVAGGTGGHITPAVAVANHLEQKLKAGVEILFVTGGKAIERKAFEAAGRKPISLACDRAPSLSPQGMRHGLALGVSFIQAVRLLKREKPALVFATGGYVCSPVLLAARLLGIPYFLHESNSVPGKVTRWFARGAVKVFLGTSLAAEGLANARTELTGTPVRAELFGVSRVEALRTFGFERNLPGLLILGGSQGALALNDCFTDFLQRPNQQPQGKALNILWCTGPLHQGSCTKIADEYAGNHQIVVRDYVDNMGAAYAIADVVMSRAGAGTIAELLALEKPSLLIPYPHAADNHQEWNARAVEEAGAGLMVPESELSSDRLFVLLNDLFKSPAKLDRMAEGCRYLSPRNVLECISQSLLTTLPTPPLSPQAVPTS
jgi:UDP-N-acetylglucosamine--N-acetylmuramyl-(pentapeptide) pyrophosphoryl-undecaprenol N-acetylglucosamine transferase